MPSHFSVNGFGFKCKITTAQRPKELQRLANITRSGDLQLGGWCAPEPCHAEVIKSAIEWLVNQEKG